MVTDGGSASPKSLGIGALKAWQTHWVSFWISNGTFLNTHQNRFYLFWYFWWWKG